MPKLVRRLGAPPALALLLAGTAAAQQQQQQAAAPGISREAVDDLARRLALQGDLAAGTADAIRSAPAEDLVELLRSAELNGVGSAWFARRSVTGGLDRPHDLSAADRATVVRILQDQAEGLREAAQSVLRVGEQAETPAERADALAWLRASEEVLIAAGSPVISAPRGEGDFHLHGEQALIEFVAGAAPTVAGGSATIDFPSVAAIVTNSNGEAAVTCTGTLIAPRAVLTAAHCVRPPHGATPVSVFFQHAGLFEVDPAAVFVRDGYSGHPAYLNDLAILGLREPVRTVKPAQITTEASFTPGPIGVFVGFGFRNLLDQSGQPVPSSSILQETGLKLSGQAETKACGKVPQLGPAPGRICWEYKGAGLSPSTTCPGDSGGPLFIESGTRWRLAGVTSFNWTDLPGACPIGSFAVDVDLTAHRTWIAEKVAAIAAAPAAPVATAMEPVLGGGGRYILSQKYGRILPGLTNKTFNVTRQHDLLLVTLNASNGGYPLQVVLKGPDGTVRCNYADLPPLAACPIANPELGRWRLEVNGAHSQEYQFAALVF